MFYGEQFKKEVDWEQDNITILNNVIKDGLTEKPKCELRYEEGSKPITKGRAFQAEKCSCRSRTTTFVFEEQAGVWCGWSSEHREKSG